MNTPPAKKINRLWVLPFALIAAAQGDWQPLVNNQVEAKLA